MKTEPITLDECKNTQCPDCVYLSFEKRDRPYWECPVRIKMQAEATEEMKD